MRHRVYGKKLGRSKNQRTGLFKSLVQSLFTHGTITTSQTKAHAIKAMVDKIITLAKNKNTQRLLQSYFTEKALQERLIKEIVPNLGTRVSGFTSSVRLGAREGDRTMLVRMSIIGHEEMKPILKQSRIMNNESSEKQVKVEPKKVSKVVKVKQLSKTSSK